MMCDLFFPPGSIPYGQGVAHILPAMRRKGRMVIVYVIIYFQPQWTRGNTPRLSEQTLTQNS
jgi:hypothetical protein